MIRPWNGILPALAVACVLFAGCGGPAREKASPSAPGDAARGAGRRSEGNQQVAGVPIYPRAQYMERLSDERTRSGQGEAALTGMAVRVWIYYTDDPLAKVVEWYTDRLGLQPTVTEFDLGGIDKLRLGQRGSEAHFALAPLPEGRQGSRSLSVMNRDIQLPPGGYKRGERVRARIVDKTTIRILETSIAAGHRAPGEEPPR